VHAVTTSACYTALHRDSSTAYGSCSMVLQSSVAPDSWHPKSGSHTNSLLSRQLKKDSLLLYRCQKIHCSGTLNCTTSQKLACTTARHHPQRRCIVAIQCAPCACSIALCVHIGVCISVTQWQWSGTEIHFALRTGGNKL
jgi:hypothetical protein